MVAPTGDEGGFFVGATVRRLGVPILGSPFPGWTTGPMGFTLTVPADRAALLDALARFALKDLRCLHLEVMDRLLPPAEAPGRPFHAGRFETYELDLTRTEDELFSGMASPARRSFRKSVKEA